MIAPVWFPSVDSIADLVDTLHGSARTEEPHEVDGSQIAIIALVFEKNGRCFGVTHENGRRVTSGSSRGA